jgi:DNA repair protein RecO (recombination protein O)
MEERATGIVLRLHPLTETSLIVHWLCRDQGRLSTVAKGARRPKSVFRGKLDLFFQVDFTFYRSRTSDLHLLREARLNRTFPQIRSDLNRLSLAAYAAALIEATSETDTPLEEGYRLMMEYLEVAATATPGPLLVLAFEVKWLHELGLMPGLGDTKLNPNLRQCLREVLSGNWSEIGRRELPPSQINTLNAFLLNILRHHVDRLPPSRASAMTGITAARLPSPAH